MFLKIHKLAKEIVVVLLKLFCNLMDGMPLPASIQSKANEKLVTLNSSIQTLNQPINCVEVVVKDICTLGCSIKLCQMRKRLFTNLGRNKCRE